MLKSHKKMLKKARGQGMVEYIIIVAVIGVAAIGVFGYMGDSIREQAAGLTAEISGGDAADQIAAAAARAGDADASAADHRTLGNYNDNDNDAAVAP